jgi:hypothetical protein
VSFDAVFALVIDRPHRQLAFQLFEGGFDFAQLQVELPECGGTRCRSCSSARATVPRAFGSGAAWLY